MGWDTVARGIIPCGVIIAPGWYLGMSDRLSSCSDGKAHLSKINCVALCLTERRLTLHKDLKKNIEVQNKMIMGLFLNMNRLNFLVVDCIVNCNP
jgi:hypothetical protein